MELKIVVFWLPLASLDPIGTSMRGAEVGNQPSVRDGARAAEDCLPGRGH